MKIKNYTIGHIEGVILDHFRYSPADRASYDLYKMGIREADLQALKVSGKSVLPDTMLIPVINSLRVRERS